MISEVAKGEEKVLEVALEYGHCPRVSIIGQPSIAVIDCGLF